MNQDEPGDRPQPGPAHATAQGKEGSDVTREGMTGGRRRLPRAIWALGIVSLLMDVSSEMIHGLLPVFLVSTLGASTVTVGLIEGIGEAVASVTKVVSGALSDRLGKRKALALLGYGLATLSKPIFALAPTAGWVLGARLADRLGKGIRGAPRDALVGDLSPPGMEGAAFGLRQALDNVGAFVGPGLAIALMVLMAGDMRAIFWIALIPGAAALLVLALGVRDPAPQALRPKALPLGRAALAGLGRRFWAVVAVAAVLTLARFSEAFVILRAQDLGLTATLAPLILVVVHLFSAASSYPAGRLSDRWGPRGLLVAGFAVLGLADVLLALADGVPLMMLATALWGLHLGLTQGVLSAQVSNAAPEGLRATAFGVFHLLSGLALLGASALAGLIWHLAGAPAAFWFGAGVTAVGLAGWRRIDRGA